MNVEEALSLLEMMRTERSGVDAEWKHICTEIAPYAAHASAITSGATLNGWGQRRRDDSHLHMRGFIQNVSQQAASVIAGHLLEGVWHQFRFRSEVLNEISEAQQYLEDLRDVFFGMRGRPNAAFAESLQDAVRSGLDFGILPLRVYAEDGRLSYHSPFPQGIYLREDGRGRLISIAHCYHLRAREAVAQFGNAVAPELQEEAKDARQNRPHRFLYLCSKEGEQFWCGYIDETHRKIMWQKTEPNPPLVVARFARGDTGYGFSPGRAVINDVRCLHKLENGHFLNARMLANPPWAVYGDNTTPEVAPAIVPGRVYSGMMQANGQPLMQPMSVAAIPQISAGQIERLRGHIQQTYFADILTQSESIPNATATAVAALEESKRIRLSSVALRLEGELFSPMIAAEMQTVQAIDFEREARGEAPLLPQIPNAVLQAAHENGLPLGLRIEYTGFIQKVAQQRETQAVRQMVQDGLMLAQFDQGALEKINTDTAYIVLQKSSDAPASLLRSDAETAARQRGRDMAEAQVRAEQEAAA